MSEEYKRSKFLCYANNHTITDADITQGEEEIAAARSSAGDVEEREEIFVRPPPPLSTVAPPREGRTPVIIEAGPPRGAEIIEYDRTVYRDSDSRSSSSHRHSGTLVARSRSRSRSGRDIRAEIKALERELTHRPKNAEVTERYTERGPNGELIVYEEAVETIKAPHKPPRIEKDKKGRMSISLPKYR